MARCRRCRRSGFFLRLDDDRLCDVCGLRLREDISSASRIIGDSVPLIETSKNPSTRLSRCDLVLEHAERLLPYERLGIPTLETPPSEIMEKVKTARDQIEAMVMDEPTARTTHPDTTRGAVSVVDDRDYANSNVMAGIEFAATLSLDTPLSVLQRHGEVHEGPPSERPDYGDMSQGVWVPIVDWESVGLEPPEDGMMASAIGQVPTDGGALLPFLLEFRRIVEGSGSVKEQLSAIRRLRNSSPEYKRICRQFGTNFPKAWFAQQLKAIPGVGEKTALALFEAGFHDQDMIRSAADTALLTVAGVGPGLLKKIRSHQHQSG